MDYSSFLEMSFALNVLFVAWDYPTEKARGRLLDKLKKDFTKYQVMTVDGRDLTAEEQEAKKIFESNFKKFEKMSSNILRCGKKCAFFSAFLCVSLAFLIGGTTESLLCAALYGVTILPAPISYASMRWFGWRCAKKKQKDGQKSTGRERGYKRQRRA